jgi:ribosome-binding factor A
MRSRKSYGRIERVNEALREVIADELELIGDEEIELVTVTGVNSHPDLRHATVWFSALSSGKAPEVVAETLAGYRVRLQAAVARQLRLKRTPELVFRSDPAIAVGTRVEDVLKDIKRSPQEGEDRIT